MCSIALKLGEYAWTEAFIAAQSPRIAEEFRGSAVAYNTANLHFHQQHYDEALRALAQVEYSDVYYALDTRRITLMVYVEREDVDGVANLVPAFRSYLKRVKGISVAQRKGYKNFVDWVAKLMRMSPANLRKDRDHLVKSLSETQPLAAREWLQGRLAKN